MQPRHHRGMVTLLQSRHRAVRVLAGLATAGLAVTVGLAVSSESAGSLSVPGGPATALGRLTGLVGTYLMLIAVVLVARLPALERAVGQDRLVRWHRRLAPWPLFLIAAHGVLIAVESIDSIPAYEALVVTDDGSLLATPGFG